MRVPLVMLLVGLVLPAAKANAAAIGNTCEGKGDGDQWCSGEEDSSLLAMRIMQKTGSRRVCSHGAHSFLCDGECCGGGCVAAGAPCCTNEDGTKFGCGIGNACCGNVCARNDACCCESVDGYRYPVSNPDLCPRSEHNGETVSKKRARTSIGGDAQIAPARQSSLCPHPDGYDFMCYGDCCGGSCIEKDATCCTAGDGTKFGCSLNDSCCGDLCANSRSFCCTNGNGVTYPVAHEKECPWAARGASNEQTLPTRVDKLKHLSKPGAADQHTSMAQLQVTKQQFGVCKHGGYEFLCHGDCCGAECLLHGAPCCTTGSNTSFGCGLGDVCCGDVCASRHSYCCTRSDGVKFPVAYEDECPWAFTEQTRGAKATARSSSSEDVQVAQTRQSSMCRHPDGYDFICYGDCCGGSCIEKDATCCTADDGSKFGCGLNDSCCGNLCANSRSFCCTNGNGVTYPVAHEEDCPWTAQGASNEQTLPTQIAEPSETVDARLSKVEQTGDPAVKLHHLSKSDALDQNASMAQLQVTKQEEKVCKHGGYEFLCHGDCCGAECLLHGAPCCTTGSNTSFGCGLGDVCCGDVCANRHSYCCTRSDGVKFPVAYEDECPWAFPETARLEEQEWLSQNKICDHPDGSAFACYGQCCGAGCLDPDAQCCVSKGVAFGCGLGETCCGEKCAAKNERCCTAGDGSKYTVAEAEVCPFEKPF